MQKTYDIAIAFAVLVFWTLSFTVGNLLQTYLLDRDSTQRFLFSTPFSPEPVLASDNVPPHVLGVEKLFPTVSAGTQVEIRTDEQLVTNKTTELIEEGDGYYRYKIELEDLKEGQNRISLDLTDKAGNTVNHQLTVERIHLSKCLKKSKRPVTQITDPDQLTAVLDKYHRVDAEYVPRDLVNGKTQGLPTFSSSYIRYKAFPSLQNMINTLQQNGVSVTISTGWRGFAHQQRVYNEWIAAIGSAKASNYVALPGHSEHHLGTALDLLTNENGYSINAGTYEKTRLSKWMRNNAQKYGFVLSYPSGKEQLTGYNYEPWHWRYVGREIAMEIKRLRVSTLEYLYYLNQINCN